MNGRQRSLHLITASLVALLGTAALLFLLRGSTPVQASPTAITHCVAPSGNCSAYGPCWSAFGRCHTTIQAAVDAAGDGDEIRVEQGHYTGTHVRAGARQVVYITKTVTLRGGYDSDFQQSFPLTQPTVVDAGGQGRVIHMVYASPTVEGLWITGGDASHAVFDEGRGGGIYSNGGDPVIANNVISSNLAYTSSTSYGYGGGIYLRDSFGGAVISGNRVISNVASTAYQARGGGMYIQYADGVQVLNNVVLTNTGTITNGSGQGGGIMVSDSEAAVVEGNTVAYNVTQAGSGGNGYGGGIDVVACDGATLSNNLVRHNTVGLISLGGYGGGVYLLASDGVHVHGNTLESNRGTGTGGGNGGGLAVHDSYDLLLSANRVFSNATNRGGGFYLSRDTTFTMTNNVVAGNVASSQGGGLAFYTGPGEAVTGTLLHNTFAANDGGSGEGRSAIHTRDPYVSLVLTNNLIISHTYGVIAVPTSTVRLYNTLFYANGTDTSGAGWITDTNPITGQDPLLDMSYHLQAGSPAIGAGVDAGVATDVDGDPRIGLPDVGVDEFITTIALPLVMREP